MRALVFWFTGLSGSGKSTIANAVSESLIKQGYKVLILDGDYVRTHLHVNLGFSRADIMKNNALIAELCQKYRSEYNVILVPIISPYRVSRSLAKEALSPGFYEVYVSANLETVMKRDVKGLYAKAQRGEIPDMIGFSPESLYEPPLQPDHVVQSGAEAIAASQEAMERFVLSQLKGEKGQ
jgi:adenylyl-sulfate kinase